MTLPRTSELALSYHHATRGVVSSANTAPSNDIREPATLVDWISQYQSKSRQLRFSRSKLNLARPVCNKNNTFTTEEKRYRINHLSIRTVHFACRVWLVEDIVLAVALHSCRVGPPDFMFFNGHDGIVSRIWATSPASRHVSYHSSVKGLSSRKLADQHELLP